MNREGKNRPFGIASLFEKEQLRTGFSNYIYIIIGLELIIFLAMLISAGLNKTPIPWKGYLFAAFTVPVAITLLVGLIIRAFNALFFDQSEMTMAADQGDPTESNKNSTSHLPKTSALVDIIRRIPIMLTLFMMLIGSLAAYKLEDVVTFMVNASGHIVRLLFIAGGVLLLLGTVLAIVWLVSMYKLRKLHLTYLNNYRHAALEKLESPVIDEQMYLDADPARLVPFKRAEPSRQIEKYQDKN